MTKIKFAEDALRDSERRFQNLVELFACAVWEADADGVAIGGNSSWCAFTGQKPDDVSGAGWLQAIHPDDRARAALQWRAAVASGQHFEAEYRVRTKDDGWRWTNARAMPILSTDGKILKWMGINIDIDARKQAEVSLRETEEKQAFLLKLIDELRNIADPWEIQATACRMLSEFFNVNRVVCADIEGDTIIVRQGHARGVSPFMARMPLTSLGEKLVDRFRRGEIVAIENVFEEEGLAAAEREQFKAAEIAALMSAVLMKEGRWVGVLSAHHAAPRAWRPQEINLLREVSERIWSSTVRARIGGAAGEPVQASDRPGLWSDRHIRSGY